MMFIGTFQIQTLLYISLTHVTQTRSPFLNQVLHICKIYIYESILRAQIKNGMGYPDRLLLSSFSLPT